MKKLLLLAFITTITCSISFGQGTIRGKVSDENGEPLIGAIIMQLNGTRGTTTDLDGNYSITFSDSTVQTLVFSFVSYETKKEVVHPVNGKVIIKDVGLKPASAEMKEVLIEGKASKAKDYYMEKIKMNSSTTLDYISAETMKKTGDANVVAAVARVSGVSSTSSGFITVRGIGDRYIKTTLNGARIPTLDPFTNNIKLDLFPASLVDNIIITKTASPDLPGDWAGAYISIETKDYPEKLVLNVETSFGYNNQTTFKDMVTSQRSPTDWLGYDNGFRNFDHATVAIPRTGFGSGGPFDISQYEAFVVVGLGDYYKSLGVTGAWAEGSNEGNTYYKLGLVQLGLLPKALFNDADAVASADKAYKSAGGYREQAFNSINAPAVKFGQSLPNNWTTSTKKAPLNFSQSFSIGNQTTLFGKPLGFIGGFRYGSSIANDPNSTYNRIGTAGLTLVNNSVNLTQIDKAGTQHISAETNGWSALLNIAYKYAPNHSLSLLYMPNLTGVNRVRNTEEVGLNVPSGYIKTHSQDQFYEERQQMVYQLKSEHYIPGPKLKMELNASYTKGKSSAPDFKILQYGEVAGQPFYEINTKDYKNTSRLYRYLVENLFDSRLSLEIPLGEKPGLVRKIKAGGAYQSNSYENDQYAYVYRAEKEIGVPIINNDFDEYFSLDKFGTVNSTLKNYYLPVGDPRNHSIGFSKIQAGYAMVDYALIPSLRFSGGLRVEHTNMLADVRSYYEAGLPEKDSLRGGRYPGIVNEVNYLPCANVIYKLKRSELAPINLRLNYSKSLARPSIRELTNVEVYDFDLQTNVIGYPDLKMVEISNYDLRLESYFKSGDNVSLSLFYKDFKNHIELVQFSSWYSWQNTEQSRAMGIELEGKKKISKHLELRSNITFVRSYTKFIQKTRSLGTDGFIDGNVVAKVTRPMFGQSPYIINGILAYTADSLGLTAAISYNVQGPKFVLVSYEFPKEIYELPRHLIDVKVSKTLGKHFSASLTVRDVLNAPVRRSHGFPEGWIFDFDKYRYGTNFLLGISYKI